MAINPLSTIAGPESNFGNNTVNPNSSARGIWQDISSTWQGALTGIGINPAQYPTANDAPPSVQAAANAWLYNQQGFAPWTIGDPTLASEIAAAGGPSAFAAPGTLSTNPADYASLDQAQQSGSLASALQSGNFGGGNEAGQTIPIAGNAYDPIAGFGGYPTYDPLLGSLTPGASGAGAPGATAPPTSGSSQGATLGGIGQYFSFSNAISNIEGFFIRLGVFGLGLALIGIAITAIVFSGHGKDIKEAVMKAV